MFIDISEDLDYEDDNVKVMIEDLQKTLNNICESGYFLYPSDWEGGVTFNEQTEELFKLPTRD